MFWSVMALTWSTIGIISAYMALTPLWDDRFATVYNGFWFKVVKVKE
jgi:hypothetical protein